MQPDRQLAVLLLSPESTGGIGAHVRMLAEGLVARGVTVTVSAPRSTLERFSLAETGAEVMALPVGSVAGWRATRARLRAVASAHDVTHAHGVRVAATAAVAGVSPLVATWHNAPLGPARRRVVHRALELVSARRSALVLGASPDLVRRARSAGARRAQLCEVAAPPLPAAVQVDAVDLHDPPRVLAIGRLHPQKRFDLLVSAAAAWPTGPDRPEFLIAGDGPLAQSLAQQADQLGAPVAFLGARNDVADLLATADVVVLSSDWEARPLVAQEALRAGVPLVATDVGGVRELVGEAALLVRPGDPAALAAGIGRVLRDEALRERLRLAGPAQASTWPTVDEMVDQLLQEYLDLSSRSRSSLRPAADDTPSGADNHRAND